MFLYTLTTAQNYSLLLFVETGNTFRNLPERFPKRQVFLTQGLQQAFGYKIESGLLPI